MRTQHILLLTLYLCHTNRCRGDDLLEAWCPCQSGSRPHFKEKKDRTNPCNAVEVHLNDIENEEIVIFNEFKAQIPHQLLQEVPSIKFPGRKMVKHGFMTMVLYKPIHIDSMPSHLQQNVYVHWLISKVPSAASRVGEGYTFHLLPGFEYIEYEPLEPNTRYILAFYHQHETQHYFSAHRFRKQKHFFDSLGDLIVCNILEITE